jgi:hypothetical protein
MFHCLFIVLKIPLFSMPFSRHDPVIRMFHCLFIVLKISLFSMPSSHDPVIRSFHSKNVSMPFCTHWACHSARLSCFYRKQRAYKELAF